MNREEILENVTAAFKTILEHDNFILTNETTAEDVEGWESVTHMMIITEIENKLDIVFKLNDLMNMNNIGDLLKIIAIKLN